MPTYLPWIFWGLAGLVAALWLLPKIRTIWPAAVPQGLSDAAEKFGNYADLAAAVGAITTLRLLAAKRGDAEMVAALKPAWDRAWTWDDEPTEKSE